MEDPYVIKVSEDTEVLKNLLNIEDQDELRQAEADIGFTKIINVGEAFRTTFDAEYLKNIHRHIFSDIYDWAGEYRTVPIVKEEVVIPGYTMPYSSFTEIEKDLPKRIAELEEVDWTKFENRQQLSLEFAKRLAKIWLVHPFRDGNTRTVLTFADMFSRAKGFPINTQFLLDNLDRKIVDGRIVRYNIRDKFALAAIPFKEYAEPQHLAALFDKAIELGRLPNLKNNDDGFER